VQFQEAGYRWLSALLVAAGIAGLGFAATGGRATLRLYEDERDFVSAATNLTRYGVLSFSAPGASAPAPSAYREPAYPALIALAWRTAGFAPPTDFDASSQLPAIAAAWRPIRALNLALLAISALAMASAVGRLCGHLGGALAFAFVACSPALHANVPKAMAENLGAAHISLAALCLLALARSEPGARLATLFVVGLLPLSRAEGSLLLPAAVLIEGLTGRVRPRSRRLGAGAILALGLAVPGALWMTRNAAHLGHAVLADRSGLAFAVRSALDSDVDRFGARSALLAWTPLEVERRESLRSSPEPTWLDLRPLRSDNYYFRTLRRWQQARRAESDSLAVDASFRRAALLSFVASPWAHIRGAAAVAWRGLFAERPPGWIHPFDLTLELGLLLAAALSLATTWALVYRSPPVLALFAPSWVLFSFHVAATELLPRYAVPLLPLAWAALAFVLCNQRSSPWRADLLPARSASTSHEETR
jgi:hypothetical protein